MSLTMYLGWQPIQNELRKLTLVVDISVGCWLVFFVVKGN
jgi:hypothetical protein